MKLFTPLIFFLLLLFNTSFILLNKELRLISLYGRAQGTTYSIKYVNADSSVTSSQIDSILRSIDSSLSLYKPYSLISKVNKSIHCARLDSHFKNVFTASIHIAIASNGAFDPTCKPLSELWGFGVFAKPVTAIPSQMDINKTLKLVGYKKVFIQHDSLCKAFPKMKIDLDGIAQGYSVDIISAFLLSKGIDNFLVELGGEIFANGKNLQSKPWTVGMEDPSENYDQNLLIRKKILLHNAAITTSGNYRKFKKYGNDYFGHILDPIKGIPVSNGIISVSVLAENATTADGWDNAFMVMGINKAIQMADSLNGVGVYLLYKDKHGAIKDTCNSYFKEKMQ